jgi:hypothetical protein
MGLHQLYLKCMREGVKVGTLVHRGTLGTLQTFSSKILPKEQHGLTFRKSCANRDNFCALGARLLNSVALAAACSAHCGTKITPYDAGAGGTCESQNYQKQKVNTKGSIQREKREKGKG